MFKCNATPPTPDSYSYSCTMIRASTTIAVLSAGAVLVQGLDNGLARTPQMGYNSWYDLMGTLTEDAIKDTADAMVELGLLELGYTYLNLDDDWASGRDGATGRLVADPKHWSNGTLAAAAAHAHGRGLLFGTYTDRGTQTCGGRPGAQGSEALDAQTYADWGVDYLKEDSCHAKDDPADGFRQYRYMRDALNATGRAILFSLCGWHSWYAPPDPAHNYTGGTGLGNSWRIGPDDTNWGGVLANIDINAGLAAYAGPGGWNDPCLLLSTTWDSKQRVTELQSRSQFSMWAVMASPLLISGNLRNISDYTLETYKNAEVIRVSQDAAGKQGTRIVGGPLKGGKGPAPARTSAAACGSSSSSSSSSGRWAWGTGAAAGYLLNTHSKLALNVDDCKQDLVYFSPVTKGTTCVGPSGVQFDNLRFNATVVSAGPAAGLSRVQSAMDGHCVTQGAGAGGGALSLAPCDDKDARQLWLISPADSAGSFTLANSATKACMDGESSTASATNVWARPLASGGAAAVFLNNGAADANIDCDAACFAAMGFKTGATLAVRDLWAHADLPLITVTSATAFVADGTGTANGGATMFTFTPQ